MLTHLRFKNWRSLRDVTIEDLTPITVLIGPNSSGKTNILDALYFLRDMMSEDILQAVYKRGGGEKIRTFGAAEDEPVEIEFTSHIAEFTRPLSYGSMTWRTRMIFANTPYTFKVRRTLWKKDLLIFDDPHEMPGLFATEDFNKKPTYVGEGDYEQAQMLLGVLTTNIISRWQMLDENFMPPLGRETSKRDNPVVIDRCADNLVFMLDFMRETHPELYNKLQHDARYLLEHVSQIQTERDEHEARLLVHETTHPNRAAPTVSSGTARVFAMLMAYYALDMRLVKQPGLVVIEEPDTALNPGLLRNFVELLREYVDREEPRQFILTTHNPALLNHFHPEEVRIVSRDEQGYTVVNRVPDYIKDIWLNEHGLGEVWLTNAFGGVAE